MTMRKMSAMREIHPEDGIAMIERRHQHGHVRLCTRVRLNIRVFGAKDLFRPIDRGLFDDIGEFASAIIPLARISLGVLVREDGPHRLKHGFGYEVLRRDKLEPVRLPADLIVDSFADERIRF
jgi:hypothetical protein